MSEARKRVVIYPRQLKDLIAEFGRYNLITREAWAKWDREQDEWRQRYRADQCAIYILPDGSIDNPNGIDLTGTQSASRDRMSPATSSSWSRCMMTMIALSSSFKRFDMDSRKNITVEAVV
jgi:hypothetical protein